LLSVIGGSADVGRFDGAKMFGALSQDIDAPAGPLAPPMLHDEEGREQERAKHHSNQGDCV
jgi:hypothetical protein